jgi:hypothetical protein
VDPSSNVLILKAVGSAGEQMHFPRCLKSPFEKERGRILQRSSFGVEGHVPRSALSGRLANFFKVYPRGDAKSLERRQEREGLSPVYIRDRASNPNSEIELQ